MRTLSLCRLFWALPGCLSGLGPGRKAYPGVRGSACDPRETLGSGQERLLFSAAMSPALVLSFAALSAAAGIACHKPMAWERCSEAIGLRICRPSLARGLSRLISTINAIVGVFCAMSGLYRPHTGVFLKTIAIAVDRINELCPGMNSWGEFPVERARLATIWNFFVKVTGRFSRSRFPMELAPFSSLRALPITAVDPPIGKDDVADSQGKYRCLQPHCGVLAAMALTGSWLWIIGVWTTLLI